MSNADLFKLVALGIGCIALALYVHFYVKDDDDFQ